MAEFPTTCSMKAAGINGAAFYYAQRLMDDGESAARACEIAGITNYDGIRYVLRFRRAT